MKKLLTVILLTTFAAAAFAGTAFLRGEIVTGMTKQCIYDYLGNMHTITIKSFEMCPMSIKV